MILALIFVAFLQYEAHAEAFLTEIARAGVEKWEAVFRAQTAQESAWKQYAESRYAQGLTQFTPPTRGDIYPQTEPSCEGASPFDPPCAFRAMILYDTRLLRANRTAESTLDQWAMTLAAYNGGQGNLNREKRDCAADLLCDPDVWFDNLEDSCTVRSAANCHENREYPRRILRRAGMLK